MRALYLTSEAYPLAKSGGLADVTAALPKALAARGMDVRLLLPGYLCGLRQIAELQSPVAAGSALDFPFRLLLGQTPDSRLPAYLLDCLAHFGRPGGLYQDESGLDWPDNAMRFGALCQVAAALALGTLDALWRPDVAHLDMATAELMVAGSDLWLYTPMLPLEASGTNGMKAALNGVLNLSVLDGWWVEACIEGVTGWGIEGDGSPVNALYDTLEGSVLPLYYDDRRRWLWMMKQAIS